MKRKLIHITQFTIISFMAAVIAYIAAPYVFAQEWTTITSSSTIDDYEPCQWTGTPGDPGSDLTVADGETCILTGTLAANNVTVATDGGLGGGTLIIGSDTGGVNTVFTIHGSGDFQGAVEVGQSGDPANNSELATNTADVTVSTQYGDFRTISNSNGTNKITLDQKLLISNRAYLRLYDPSITNNIGSLEIQSGSSSSTWAWIESDVSLYINSVHDNCNNTAGYYCSIELGTDTAAGESYLLNYGTITVPNNATYDANIEIGAGGHGYMQIDENAVLTVQETSGQFYVRHSPTFGYGVYILGNVTLQNGSEYMKFNILNGNAIVFDDIDEFEFDPEPAYLTAGQLIENSAGKLVLGRNSTVTINGTANMDGDVEIDNNAVFTTTNCAMVGTNGFFRTTNAAASPVININNSNSSCTLSGRSANEGLILLGGFSLGSNFINNDVIDLEIWKDLIVEGIDGYLATDVDEGNTTVVHGNVDINSTADYGIYVGGTFSATGTFDANTTSEAYFYGTASFGGTCNTDGVLVVEDNLLDPYPGVQSLTCVDSLTLGVNSVSEITIDSEATVTGATAYTDVYGDLTLDGTLNSGDLTVAGSGIIHSGISYDTGENQPSGFYINADNIDVQGSIQSDAVSYYGTGYDDAGGSYGGEGLYRGTSSGGNTYGPVKFTWSSGSGWSDEPYYGQRGITGGLDGTPGGGAVRIKATGNINIDGYVTANGGSSLIAGLPTGSGGTVIIIHDILNTETSKTFTGTGVIEAIGGDSDMAEAGGGGRIVIDSPLFDDPDDGTAEYGYSGTISARGGIQLDTFLYGDLFAAAGTIYLVGDNNNPNGTLIADQGNSLYGSGPPSGTPQPETYIQNNSEVFDRIETRKEAVIRFAAAPASDPVSCYEVVGGFTGYVNGLTGGCNPYADKPYRMYINNSVAGAQAGDEPAGASATIVGDLTPVFSIMIANPELTTQDYTKVEVEVVTAGTDGIPFTGDDTVMWDAADTNNPVILAVGKNDGEQTADFDYGGDALTSGVTYYVRMRVLDGSDNPGLWNHMDIGNHYKFEINNYLAIDPLCTDDAFSIKDINHPNFNVTDAPGHKFGEGRCEILFNSLITGGWDIKIGLANGETDFDDGSGNNIDPIDNSTTCDMDETGNGTTEQYGYNISDFEVGTIDTDTETACSGVSFQIDHTGFLNLWRFHDVEAYSGENVAGGTGNVYDEYFYLNLFTSITGSTVTTNPYALNMSVIATTPP